MNESLSERSYQHIRRKLVSGVLAHGARLVNRALAEEIGVSVIPVREAIHRLASEGMVEHVPGAGAFVRKPDGQELDNLYVLRDALESCAAGEAARYITDSQLEELEAILADAWNIVEQIREQTNGHATKRQLNAWLDNEQQFHELLVEASRNPLLAKVVHEHRAVSEIFAAQRQEPSLLTTEVVETTCDGKKELLQALRDHDGQRARTLMSDQIQRGRKLVLGYFRNRRRS